MDIDHFVIAKIFEKEMNNHLRGISGKAIDKKGLMSHVYGSSISNFIIAKYRLKKNDV